jgi:putative tricarboxylic transport membrane protein
VACVKGGRASAKGLHLISDRVIFICTLIVTAAYFYGTRQIPTIEIGDPLGPRAFPYLITIGLLISAAWLLIEILQARKSAPQPEVARGEPGEKGHVVVICAVVAWTGLYFAVFQRLGFLLSTGVFLLALMAYFNRGKWLANGLTAVLFTVGIYALFTKALGVTLAKGLLSF